MVWKFVRSFAVCATALGLAGGAFAQPAQVTSTLQVQKVVVSGGKTVLEPATAGKPGDVLQYNVRYDNRGASAALGLKAELPIPPGTTFVADSAVPAGAEASVDGVHFAPMPLMHTVKLADGREQQQPIPPSAYRALRWSLGALASGKSEQIHARVRVNPVEQPAAPASAAPKS